MTLVILAAGMGSRYGALKQLDPITDHYEFIIDFSIFDSIREGFDKVVFIIKEENFDAFQDTIGKRVEKKIKVEYAFQSFDAVPFEVSIPEFRKKPLGTSHALLCAEDKLNDNFAVINADDFYGRDAFAKLSDFLGQTNGTNYCMVGYKLSNTLSENGTVARGICKSDAEGYLDHIAEYLNIEQEGDHAAFIYNGEKMTAPLCSLVSMNCWGFTPEIFPALKGEFQKFMNGINDTPNPLKAEFLLPNTVQDLINQGQCTIKVLNTNAKWYGVTYKDDKPATKDGLQWMIDSGEYPDGLWN
ncbi:MAG: nucleotidyltransferase [Eggerthellaceae bacterium]|nr:nucleotidyltransferase [Eggerthellaceae bacterium]